MKKKSRSSLAVILFAFIWIIVGYFVFNWYVDCWKNNKKVLLRIGLPMQENVYDFFKEHQRYPDLKESKMLIEKSGCVNIKQRQKGYSEKKNKKGKVYERWAGYYCDSGNKKIRYSLSVGDLLVKHNRTFTEDQPFRFSLRKGNTRCSASFEKDGYIYSHFTCQQDSCLLKNLSH